MTSFIDISILSNYQKGFEWRSGSRIRFESKDRGIESQCNSALSTKDLFQLFTIQLKAPKDPAISAVPTLFALPKSCILVLKLCSI